MGDTRLAVFARRQTDGQRTFVEIVDFRTRAAGDQRSGLDVVLVEGRAQPSGHLHIECVHTHLAGGKAERVDFSDGRLGIAAAVDDEAEPHGGLGRCRRCRADGGEDAKLSARIHGDHLSTIPPGRLPGEDFRGRSQGAIVTGVGEQ